MTAAAELELLETAYAAILTGQTSAYSINGRSVTKIDIGWISTRMDALRLQVARESQGMFYASQFRNPE